MASRAQREAETGQEPIRRIALEVALYRVAPADDLLELADACAQRLERHVGEHALCELVMHPTDELEDRFEVILRLVAPSLHAEVQHEGDELRVVMDEAFVMLEDELVSTQSGVRLKGLRGGGNDEESDEES